MGNVLVDMQARLWHSTSLHVLVSNVYISSLLGDAPSYTCSAVGYLVWMITHPFATRNIARVS